MHFSMPIRVRFWWVRSVHLSGFAGALPGGSRPLASSNEPARKQARPVASAENKLLFHRNRRDHPPALSRLCIAARAGSLPSKHAHGTHHTHNIHTHTRVSARALGDVRMQRMLRMGMKHTHPVPAVRNGLRGGVPAAWNGNGRGGCG